MLLKKWRLRGPLQGSPPKRPTAHSQSDDEGLELPNEAAARLRALVGARDIIAEQVKHGYLVRSHWIDVADQHGEVLFAIRFGDAVEIKD